MGSERGGKALATLMSVIESAKRCGVEPWEYLKDVLDRLPDHPRKYVHELLPDQWLAARKAAAHSTAQTATAPR